MGLGLAIVSGLAQALDHPVRVASSRGRGSMFAVSAPMCPAADSAEPARQPLVDDLRGKVILVIDDDPAIREAVVEILLRWGCVPVAARGTREALAALGERGVRPDAIVVDYQLEDDRTGLEAIASLAAVYGPGIPAIIVTGDTRPERLREVSEIGHPLLYKPLAPMRLRAALSAAISID
jgi:CheY-like chemotaxis protein